MPPTDPQQDLHWMRRALALAARGRGRVEPNPMVGCVIVRDGRVIGEGWHKLFGQGHAEPEALASCDETPVGATVYVTLEPCCHWNKKTPPCVPELIRAQIGRVVVASIDPNPQVAGQGIAQLRQTGIPVEAGLLEDEARQLNAAFFAQVLHKRPYVTLKWAQSADGKVAGAGGRRVQISNDSSLRVVHELRARCDAILVGINTVLKDDPLLLARDVAEARPLVRWVLDRQLRLPVECRLVQTARQSPVVVAASDEAMSRHHLKLRSLEAAGVQVTLARPWPDLLREQHARGTTHLLVEPGPTLARSLFEDGLVDRAWVFRSPNRLDEPGAPDAPQVPDAYVTSGEADVADDRLVEYLNPSSAVYFAQSPSADLQGILARM